MDIERGLQLTGLLGGGNSNVSSNPYEGKLFRERLTTSELNDYLEMLIWINDYSFYYLTNSYYMNKFNCRTGKSEQIVYIGSDYKSSSWRNCVKWDNFLIVGKCVFDSTTFTKMFELPGNYNFVDLNTGQLFSFFYSKVANSGNGSYYDISFSLYKINEDLTSESIYSVNDTRVADTKYPYSFFIAYNGFVIYPKRKSSDYYFDLYVINSNATNKTPKLLLSISTEGRPVLKKYFDGYYYVISRSSQTSSAIYSSNYSFIKLNFDDSVGCIPDESNSGGYAVTLYSVYANESRDFVNNIINRENCIVFVNPNKIFSIIDRNNTGMIPKFDIYNDKFFICSNDDGTKKIIYES